MYKATIPQHKRLAMGEYHGPKAGPRKAFKGKKADEPDMDDMMPKRKSYKRRKGGKVGSVRTIKPNRAGQKPIKYRVGSLHSATGTPQGEKIPKSKLRKALAGGYGKAAKKKANLAVNVFHVKSKR